MLEFCVHKRGEAKVTDSTRLLELALKGLEAERAKIDDEIAQITSQLNPRPATAQTATAGRSTPLKKRRMSAAVCAVAGRGFSWDVICAISSSIFARSASSPFKASSSSRVLSGTFASPFCERKILACTG